MAYLDGSHPFESVDSYWPRLEDSRGIGIYSHHFVVVRIKACIHHLLRRD